MQGGEKLVQIPRPLPRKTHTIFTDSTLCLPSNTNTNNILKTLLANLPQRYSETKRSSPTTIFTSCSVKKRQPSMLIARLSTTVMFILNTDLTDAGKAT